MPRILLILCALPLALALAACGGAEESGGYSDATSTTSAPRQLTIVYTADEGAQPRTIEVTCDGDATGADAESERLNAAICGALETEAGLAALEQPPDGQACTMIFGGPQKAEISGTVDGSPVDTTITRANGCEIARWEALFGGSFAAAPSDDVKAALTVLYTPEEGAGPQKFEVMCGPGSSGGDEVSAQVCSALSTEAGRNAIGPQRTDMMCTEIYGGAGRATITGTLDGEPVDATVTRANGCEIDRWDTLFGSVFVLAPVG